MSHQPFAMTARIEMAVIRDVIPVFELYQPASVDDALKLLDRHGTDAMVLAGGLDNMDWLKDRLRKPKVVVDLTNIAELRGIREANGGVEIGAMTTLTEVGKHPVVREKFSLLTEAAGLVASPQIRNQGTLGGNVSQDTRCWYYRGGWACYRGGGYVCDADTPTAVNRGHASFDAAAAEERGSVRRGQAADRRDGQGGGRDGRAGRADAPAQRVQSAVDAESGGARAARADRGAAHDVARAVQLRIKN